MSPRTRTVTDAEILGATARAIGRVGPARLTLADVAAEVGLSPATLLQRFKSKRGLLLAFVAQCTTAVAEEFMAARAAHESPLATLEAALIGMTRAVETPEAMANNLAFLQMDLTDEEFHRHALAHAKAVRDEIRAQLDTAIAVGEIAVGDTERLAHAIQSTYNGALVTWAVYREGTVAAWLRRELETLLGPLRRRSADLGGGSD